MNYARNTILLSDCSNVNFWDALGDPLYSDSPSCWIEQFVNVHLYLHIRLASIPMAVCKWLNQFGIKC